MTEMLARSVSKQFNMATHKGCPMTKLVPIACYYEMSEAFAARAAVESAGIVVFLRCENIVRYNWWYTVAVGGIQLEVPSIAAETARAIVGAAKETGELETASEAFARRPFLNIFVGILLFFVVWKIPPIWLADRRFRTQLVSTAPAPGNV